jgi:uncharacterized protein (TIGR02284 family)
MNTTNNNLTTVLNDLVLVNNDRVTGYRRAADQLNGHGNDLWGLFQRMAEKSAQFAEDLRAEVIKLGGQPAAGTSHGGKIYRSWMTAKNIFSGNDRPAILRSCASGEDAAQQAYSNALREELTPSLRLLITSQQNSLKIAESVIQRRNTQEKVMAVK